MFTERIDASEVQEAAANSRLEHVCKGQVGARPKAQGKGGNARVDAVTTSGAHHAASKVAWAGIWAKVVRQHGAIRHLGDEEAGWTVPIGLAHAKHGTDGSDFNNNTHRRDGKWQTKTLPLAA